MQTHENRLICGGMKVHVFSPCWNEEVLLPYFFNHYKQRFTDIRFTIYDNMSTDASREIIAQNGAEVIESDTDGKLRTDIHAQIRNHAWKTSDADWIIVCDIDEWIDCNDAFLERTTCTVVKTEGYHMIGWHADLNKVVRGSPHVYWNKCALFNKNSISEMNYGPGCHKCKPEGVVTYNTEKVLLYHMKCFHPVYFVQRHKLSAARVSELDHRNGWSQHYYNDTIRAVAYYLRVLLNSKRVRRKE